MVVLEISLGVLALTVYVRVERNGAKRKIGKVEFFIALSSFVHTFACL